MMKTAFAAMLLCAGAVSATPAFAKVCHNSHGKAFNCHKLVKPRINLHKKHPVKIVRCRADRGKLNNC